MTRSAPRAIAPRLKPPEQVDDEEACKWRFQRSVDGTYSRSRLEVARGDRFPRVGGLSEVNRCEAWTIGTNGSRSQNRPGPEQPMQGGTRGLASNGIVRRGWSWGPRTGDGGRKLEPQVSVTTRKVSAAAIVPARNGGMRDLGIPTRPGVE